MNWNRGHSPPFQGGVAATPRSGRGGCVSIRTTPAAPAKERGHFLEARSYPSLEGGECATAPIRSQSLQSRSHNSFTPSTTARFVILIIRLCYSDEKLLRPIEVRSRSAG